MGHAQPVKSYDKKGSRSQIEGQAATSRTSTLATQAMDRIHGSDPRTRLPDCKKGKSARLGILRLVTSRIGNHENRINQSSGGQRRSLSDLISHLMTSTLRSGALRSCRSWSPSSSRASCSVTTYAVGVMGRSISSARIGLTKRTPVVRQGHVQQRDIAEGVRADGKRITGIMAGIFYSARRGLHHPAAQHGLDYVVRACGCCTTSRTVSFDYMPVSIRLPEGVSMETGSV